MIGSFQKYYRFLYVAVSVILGLAFLMSFVGVQNLLQHDKELIHKHFQQQLYALSNIINITHYQLTDLRKTGESYLNKPYLQTRSPLFQYLSDHDSLAYFHLDRLPAEWQTENANLTGLGSIRNLSDSQKLYIQTAFMLNPLLTNALKTNPTVKMGYVVRHDFFNVYPFFQSKDFRLTPDISADVDSIYHWVYPSENPQQQQVWTQVYYDYAGAGMMVSTTVPLYQGNRYIALIGFDVGLDSLNSLISLGQRAEGEIFVVNSKQQLLAHPTLVSSKDKTVKPDWEAIPPSLRNELNNFQDFSPNELHQIKDYYFYHAPIQHTDWHLVYIVNIWDRYWAILKQIGWLLGFMVLAIVLVVWATVRLTVTQFLRPAEYLIDHLQRSYAGKPVSIPTQLPSVWGFWVGLISDIFTKNRLLLDELAQNNVSLEQRVVQRTQELNERQEEILRQKDLIDQQNIDLMRQNIRMKDSIRYAQTIQAHILPRSEQLAEWIGNHWIIYQPSDIVSGDFYWAEKVEQHILIGVVDCTGHGVPGALMSMLGYALLNQIVRLRKIYEPSEILERLQKALRRNLRQEEKQHQEGMDIAICHLTPSSTGVRLKYAGAKIPLYIYDCEEFITLRPTRKSIGADIPPDFHFEQHTIELSPHAQLYLSTDGVIHQLSPYHDKFGSRRLIQLLTQCATLPFENRRNFMLQQIIDFQADQEQRDDITIIGLNVSEIVKTQADQSPD